MDIALVPTADGYRVLVDGIERGEVYRERQSTHRARGNNTRISVARSGYGEGRTRWAASNVSDEDFATRKEAVRELVARL